MRLSTEKLDKISDICISVGQVFFAAVFIEPIVSGNFDWLRIVFGIALAGISWLASITAVKEI